MQRFEEAYLPPDPVFPVDLAELGFFLAEDEKVRVIRSPEQGPRFKIDRNERVNLVHMGALHLSLHRIIMDRLIGLSVKPVQLPVAEDVTKPSVPVLVSDNISTASRVVVFIGELSADLGVFSYREVCEEGISFGSVINLAKAVLGEIPQDSPNALIVANPGQRIWHNDTGSTMNFENFRSRARRSAVGCERPESIRNAVEGNASLDEHTQYIFEKHLRPFLPLGAKVDVIGLSEGGYAALMYLKKNWNFWRPHISCIGLVNPEQMAETDFELEELVDPKSFVSFVRDRTRAWILSSNPLGTREVGIGMHGCNCYSSGEDKKIASMVSRALPHIMAWANITHQVPSLAEDIVVVDGEPDPNGIVITSLLKVGVEKTPDDYEVSDSGILDKLEAFMNSLALESGIVTVLNTAADLNAAEALKVQEPFEDDENAGEKIDGGVSERSEAMVFHDPHHPANDIVTGHPTSAGLKDLHAIREDTDEE